MRDRVTSHDVARLAGVSRATVSTVLNHSDTVVLSDRTRERVLWAAAELGYRPNSAARMLVRGDTETIGVVCAGAGDAAGGLAPRVLEGIRRTARARGYHVILDRVEPAGRDGCEALVDSRRIDGLVVIDPPAGDPGVAALVTRGFPLVLAGSTGHPLEHSVSFAVADGASALAEHLAALGHRRVGIIGGQGDAVGPGVLSDAFARRGVVVDAADTGDAASGPAGGHAAARRLLARRPDLTALVAADDGMALGAIAAAGELGRRVPGDLSIAGFGDDVVSGWTVPPLTTVRFDREGQGVAAAEMLFRLLGREPVETPRLVLPASLVVRGSTAVARPTLQA